MIDRHDLSLSSVSMPSRRRFVVDLLLPLLVLLLWMMSAATGVSGITATTKSPAGKFPLGGITADPFVEVSPLVVGVVCRDGVLLLAIHSVFSEELNRDEYSLLVRDEDSNTVEKEGLAEDKNKSDNDEKNTKNQKSIGKNRSNIDLPRSYRGPFRIYSLDDAGETALVCAGFRNDGRLLAHHLQKLQRQDEQLFGIGNRGGGALADRAADLLAKHVVSEGRRSLSCVGLVAVGGNHDQRDSNIGGGGSGGSLYVVDATGAYAVRAHALGKGSQQVNHLLRRRSNPDWTQLDYKTVQNELLSSLGLLQLESETSTESTKQGETEDDDNLKEKGGHGKADDNVEQSESLEGIVPKGSRIEMALIQAVPQGPRPHQHRRKAMRRLFASTRI